MRPYTWDRALNVVLVRIAEQQAAERERVRALKRRVDAAAAERDGRRG